MIYEDNTFSDPANYVHGKTYNIDGYTFTVTADKVANMDWIIRFCKYNNVAMNYSRGILEFVKASRTTTVDIKEINDINLNNLKIEIVWMVDNATSTNPCGEKSIFEEEEIKKLEKNDDTSLGITGSNDINNFLTPNNCGTAITLDNSYTLDKLDNSFINNTFGSGGGGTIDNTTVKEVKTVSEQKPIIISRRKRKNKLKL